MDHLETGSLGILISVITPSLCIFGIWAISLLQRANNLESRKRIILIIILEIMICYILYSLLQYIYEYLIIMILFMIFIILELATMSICARPSQDFLVLPQELCLYWLLFCLIENILVPFENLENLFVVGLSSVLSLSITVTVKNTFYNVGSRISNRFQYVFGFLSWGIWLLSIFISDRYQRMSNYSGLNISDCFILIFLFCLYYMTNLTFEMVWMRERERIFEEELILHVMEESRLEQENTSLIHQAIHNLIDYRESLGGNDSQHDKRQIESTIKLLQTAQYPIFSEYSLLQRIVVHYCRQNPTCSIGIQINCKYCGLKTEMIICRIIQVVLGELSSYSSPMDKPLVIIRECNKDIVVLISGFFISSKQIQMLQRVLPKKAVINKDSLQKVLISFPIEMQNEF